MPSLWSSSWRARPESGSRPYILWADPSLTWASPVDSTFSVEAKQWIGRLSVLWGVSAGNVVVDGVGPWGLST